MKVVPIDSIKGAEYNPRVTDRDRLEVIKLSLRKLGFLSPVYVSGSGRILSGHQRQLAARELGWDEIPVEVVPNADRHKSLNILFNRATNDLSGSSTSAGLTAALQQSRVEELAAALPDTENRFPCVDAEVMPIDPFLAANAGRVNHYAASVAGSLKRFGILLPIVARPSRVIVNGIGRLHALAKDKEKSARFIIVPDDLADLAELTMNLLTMDFDIKGKMADEIRFHNFRRARQNPQKLGTAYGAATKIRDLSKLEDRREWIAEHGRSITGLRSRITDRG